MVWNLQMDRKTKLLVVLVMSLGWVATAVSIGRFIVYYYRFAPTNHDRTWDIGIAISIAEPGVHIMTACAPATKCLFAYLFPYFASHRSSRGGGCAGREGGGYERRGSGIKTKGFSFGLDKMEERDDGGVSEVPQSQGKSSVGYGTRGLSMDSREGLVGADRKSSMAEAEPQHCLGVAK
jgi:hypothetical protein